MHQVEIVHAEVGGKVMRSGCGPTLMTQPSSPVANQRTALNGREEEGVCLCSEASGKRAVWEARGVRGVETCSWHWPLPPPNQTPQATCSSPYTYSCAVMLY